MTGTAGKTKALHFFLPDLYPETSAALSVNQSTKPPLTEKAPTVQVCVTKGEAPADRIGQEGEPPC